MYNLLQQVQMQFDPVAGWIIIAGIIIVLGLVYWLIMHPIETKSTYDLDAFSDIQIIETFHKTYVGIQSDGKPLTKECKTRKEVLEKLKKKKEKY